MDILGWICVVFVIVIFAVVKSRKMNENYTVGSGLFKRSDYNLEKDEKMDASDYNYYNDKDQLK